MSALVVAVDTTGPRIGVAVSDGTRCVWRVADVERDAETVLAPWTADLLREAGGTFAQVVAVGVAVGPGTFTGTRVGVAHAAGLAVALAVPVVPCDGLAARAAAVGAGVVAVWLDARRDRVYAATFEAPWASWSPAADVEPAVAAATLSAGFMATGPGAVRWATVVEAAGGRLAADPLDPGMSHLVAAAWAGFTASGGVAPADLRLRYLRAPGVELR